MKLFKERLDKTIRGFVPILLFVVFLISTAWLMERFPVFEVSVIFLIVAAFGAMLIASLSMFIYWLFIEPFKKKLTTDRKKED